MFEKRLKKLFPQIFFFDRLAFCNNKFWIHFWHFLGRKEVVVRVSTWSHFGFLSLDRYLKIDTWVFVAIWRDAGWTPVSYCSKCPSRMSFFHRPATRCAEALVWSKRGNYFTLQLCCLCGILSHEKHPHEGLSPWAAQCTCSTCGLQSRL